MEVSLIEAIRKLLLFAPPFIISLTFHEYAHGWMADRLGDSTARYLGRLTMDPMAHISWIGTVVLPAFAVLTGAPLFGWANPVPVDMRNFRKPRAHMALVAAAGPLSNFFLAILFTAILSIVTHNVSSEMIPDDSPGVAGAGIQMLAMAIQLNLFLAFFNLIPLPPLDGSRIIQGFVSPKTADRIDQFAGTSQIILLVLFFTGFLRIVAMPVYGLMDILFRVFRVTG